MATQQPSQDKPLDEQPSKQPGRGAGAKFVILFLLYTAVFLAVYNLSSNSRSMNWYLFQVGRHTAALLKPFAHKCTLEGGDELIGRENYVRQATQAWARGEQAPAMDPSTNLEGNPLSSWEVYQYRQRLREALAREYDLRLAAIAGMKSLDGASLEQIKDHLQERMDRLDRGIGRPGQLIPPNAEAMTRLQAAKGRFAYLSESASQDEEQTAKDFAALLRETEQIAQAQTAFLLELKMRSSGDAIQSGPLIEFVAKVGPKSRLREIEGEIRRVNSNTLLSEEEKTAKLESLRQERDALSQSLPEKAVLAPPQGTAPAVLGSVYGDDEDRFFRFRVVPDCGALSAMAIYLAGILAFPAGFWRRIAGLALGLPVLYGINLIRLALLAGLGAYDREGKVFDFVHHYIWQGIYIIFVVAVWLLWVELFVNRRQKCETKTA